MDPDRHPVGALIDVATGALAHTSVNIDDSVTFDQEQLETYES